MKNFFLALVLALTATTAKAEVLRQVDADYGNGVYASRNIMKNTEFEKNILYVTDASGIASHQTGSAILSGSGALKIDATGSAQVVRLLAKTMPYNYSYSNCEGRFRYKSLDALYKAYVYNTNDAVKASAEYQIDNTASTSAVASRIMTIPFPCVANLDYEIRIESTSAGADIMYLDQTYMGEAFSISNGPVITEWNSYTPTGSWITNTTYTGKWRRVGDTMELDIKVAVTGAPTSASLTVQLPSGNVIDTAKINDTTAAIAAWEASVNIRDAGTDNFEGVVRYNDTTSIAILKDDGDGTVSAVTQAAPMTFATGDFVHIKVSGIPIAGWGGSGTTLRGDQTDYGWRAYTPTIGAGFGSATTISFMERRQGENLHVKGTFVAGTVANAVYTISLPGTLAIDTTKMTLANTTANPGPIVGEYDDNQALAGSGGSIVTATSTSTTLVYFGVYKGLAASSLVPASLTTHVTATGAVISVNFTVPISGWLNTSPAPQLIGSVISPSAGVERHTRARVLRACSASPCTINSQSGTWVSSITRGGAGTYTVNIVAGTFSAAPTCHVTCVATPTSDGGRFTADTTTSTISILCVDATTGGIDSGLNIMCDGPI